MKKTLMRFVKQIIFTTVIVLLEEVKQLYSRE